MMKAFWTWVPASSGASGAFAGANAHANSKWFFDKSVWQKMFRAMGGCGFNAMVLANTHPFPFMVDLEKYPDARIVDDVTLAEYQEMLHWVMRAALDYDIAPHVLFYCDCLPQSLLESCGRSLVENIAPTEFSLQYTHHCVRRLLDEYPEIAGVVADVGGSISQNRIGFVQQAILDALDAVRPDATLCLRGWPEVPETMPLKRRGGRPLHYFVKYTGDLFVDAGSDSTFGRWVDAVRAPNLVVELSFANFEPWTCYSYDTVEGVLTNLEDLGCVGFALQPLSLYDWPRSSDSYFKYQFQRDLVWYSVWGGTGTADLLGRGQPKWLLRNHRLLPGFQAGSRAIELLSLYFSGDCPDQWRPQCCSVGGSLFSVADMLLCSGSGRSLWEETTGDAAVCLAEHVQSGTPQDAYGPDELLEELADLAEQAVCAGDKGMRSASGEKELPGLARDAFCMGRLGEFYVERIRAALSHARGDDAEALNHMSRAIGIFREIRTVDSSHRGPFRIRDGSGSVQGDWTSVIQALEAEYSDAMAGKFGPGSEYAIHKT